MQHVDQSTARPHTVIAQTARLELILVRACKVLGDGRFVEGGHVLVRENPSPTRQLLVVRLDREMTAQGSRFELWRLRLARK